MASAHIHSPTVHSHFNRQAVAEWEERFWHKSRVQLRTLFFRLIGQTCTVPCIPGAVMMKKIVMIQILEADIIFNPNVRFSTEAATPPHFPDLQAVATH